MRDWKILAVLVAIFIAAYFVPLGDSAVAAAIQEGLKLLQWYARNHTLACVVPALFIAGAIATFLSKEGVLRYLGPRSRPVTAYGVASVSGTILAVCSCSVLPMFAGIYRLGAGLGPATAFLYSGPAINILAIFLTARVLGFDLGVWRAAGAIFFAVVIGLLMAAVFERRKAAATSTEAAFADSSGPRRPAWKNVVFLGSLVLFLVFSDWYNPAQVVVHRRDGSTVSGILLQETRDDIVVQIEGTGSAEAGDAGETRSKLVISKSDVASIEDVDSWVVRIFHARWYLAGAMAGIALFATARWFDRSELREWMRNTWFFTKMVVPLLFGGVFVVGFVGHLLPERHVAALVGGESLGADFFASVVGALFYFATLTEIPIVEALRKLGMGSGPALALLLAGPALSLPNLLVIGKIMGWRKTAVFTAFVVIMATLTGWIYGNTG